MQFQIDNMTCGGCARGVTRAVLTVDPEAKVFADPPTRTVRIESAADEQQVATALRAAGFPPREQ